MPFPNSSNITSAVKSIQRGTTTSGASPATVTISPVNPNKAVVVPTNIGAHTYNQGAIGYVKLKNATQIEVLSPARYDSSITTWTYAAVEWQLIEYF